MEINKIYNDDCLNIIKTFPDNSIDLIVTDPPYGINYQSNVRVVSSKFDILQNDDNKMRFIAYKEFQRILKNNCVCIIFCSWKNYADDYNELKKYFNIKNCIIWDKGGGGIGDLSHSLSTDYEMAIVCHKGMCKIRGKRFGSVWKSNKVNPIKMIHPTEKPIDIIRKMIETFSDKNDIVLDAFLGSGTTCIACKELERNFIGIEIDKKYFEIANKRIENIQKIKRLI